MDFITILVDRREKKGTTASRRLRETGRVPAVLYGLGRPNADLSIADEELHRFLKTGSKLIELKLGEKNQQAILRDLQHDPLTDAIVHVDLLRIDATHEIEVEVELEYKGLAKGTLDGGIFEAVVSAVKVRATPSKLPKVITVDISGLKVDDAILVKDLKLPEGVKIVGRKPDAHLCHCVTPKIVVVETPAVEGGAAEPERIGGKKPEDEAAPAADGKAAAPAAKKDEKKDAKK
jgi:large subunit ribosomal protein L25